MCGLSKISNKNFCWMECTIKLDVVGVHLLCLGWHEVLIKIIWKIYHSIMLCLCSTQGCTQSTTYPGLSLRGVCRGFPLATLNVTLLPVIFIGKIEPKEIPIPANFFWDISVRFLSWEFWDFCRRHDHFRRFPKKSEVFRRSPKSSEVCRRRSYRENAYPQN